MRGNTRVGFCGFLLFDSREIVIDERERCDRTKGLPIMRLEVELTRRLQGLPGQSPCQVPVVWERVSDSSLTPPG